MNNITETQILPAVRTKRGKDTIGRLFFLEASGGGIHSANATTRAKSHCYWLPNSGWNRCRC